MNIDISKEQSIVISIVRIAAMVSIVLCHIFQAYDNPLAWRFNVGVQVFLVLSGYLYGHKEIDNWIKWFWNRAKKLYIPCFLYCLVALTVLHIAVQQPVGVINYITISAVDGISHLWFMKAIFLCYMITPVLSCFRKWAHWMYGVLILLGTIEFCFLHIQQDYFSWGWLYSMGYFFPLLKPTVQKVLYYVFALLAVIVSVFVMLPHDQNMVDLWHYTCGIALCLISIALIRVGGGNSSDKEVRFIFISSIYHPSYLSRRSSITCICN